MNSEEQVDRVLGSWLAGGPTELSDRSVAAIVDQLDNVKQRRSFRLPERIANPRLGLAIGAAAVLVLAAALALGFYANRPGIIGPAPTPSDSPSDSPGPSPTPRSPFDGAWISTADADGGTQTMTVETSPNGGVSIVVYDDIASVCSLTPSTMTGEGRIEASKLIIPTPDYTCDDGSEPHLTNGDRTPLSETLRNLTYVYDLASDTLSVGPDEVWRRPDAPQPTPDPSISTSMWPQSSLAEVQQAQELADAGDPDNTWQVDPALVGGAEPWGSEVLDRFVQEKLGWDEFRHAGGLAYEEDGGLYTELVFFRCAAGQTNPLYPDDPNGANCAPTIDDTHYETVALTLEQPVRRDPSGIWVVTDWQALQPKETPNLYEHLYPDFSFRQYVQVAPPSDAEANALVEAFLEARVDGEGAEQYVHQHPGEDPISNSELVPMLLYGATSGASYERSETDRAQAAEWPSGWREFRTRLFATDGTVVEQSFAVVRQEDGQLGLLYGYPTSGGSPTIENGQPLPIPYSFLDGEVTFAADPSWSGGGSGLGTGDVPTFAAWLGNPGHNERFEIVADPLPVETGCEPGPAPADAQALVESIQSDPDLEATAPVAVSVGEIDALQMDVVASPGASVCFSGEPHVMTTPDQQWRSWTGSLAQGTRMRLYVLDLPEGSAQILAIAIAAPESEFERVLEAATPIVDSIEINAP